MWLSRMLVGYLPASPGGLDHTVANLILIRDQEIEPGCQPHQGDKMSNALDALISQIRLADLFDYVERGLMTIENAAIAVEMDRDEFVAEMKRDAGKK